MVLVYRYTLHHNVRRNLQMMCVVHVQASLCFFSFSPTVGHLHSTRLAPTRLLPLEPLHRGQQCQKGWPWSSYNPLAWRYPMLAGSAAHDADASQQVEAQQVEVSFPALFPFASRCSAPVEALWPQYIAATTDILPDSLTEIEPIAC